MDTGEAFRTILRCHEETKHHPHRYARSPGSLDWANELNPFRVFEGTAPLRLPFLEQDPGVNHFSLYDRSKNAVLPFTVKNIASFLELSLGLSAWKSYGGNTWALRMNPSSGNLHPTEAHLILPPLPGFPGNGGAFHYSPYFHALEPRASFGDSSGRKIRDHFRSDGFLIGLSSIFWRESWKYGERAFRYCNHDVGHAAACISFSANLHGWKAVSLNALSEQDMEMLLGFQKTEWRPFEREHPDLVLFVYGDSGQEVPRDIPDVLLRDLSSLVFEGRPNLLSTGHREWPVIDLAASCTAKPKTSGEVYRYGEHAFYERDLPGQEGARTIRRRRSAQAYDGKTAMPKESFYAALDKTMSRNHAAPFDMELGEITVHLLLFVHRVSGLDPGLYFLVRAREDLDGIRSACAAHLSWQRVPDAPGTLPLYLLQRGDFREEAALISCGQEIAGDGAFSAGMIARFRAVLEGRPWLYRRLFWETGMIGQVLYLEAEAHGLRGTGIGCFFDDLVHRLLGLHGDAYQSLYHFTVGGPLEDSRITTLSPYHHLEEGGGRGEE
ncbi:MAG: SagB/ThcOx family dehydrogenase [Nitrospirales bacterium]|nr:SagB/ThcOx family dehydrogenase [Nitrospirales bacterium]